MRRFRWVPSEAIDPAAYRAWLDEHGADLPAGALAFASHPNHFDYSAYRVGDDPLAAGTALCPKDLLLHRVVWSVRRTALCSI